ncbi:MAG: DASS family sodium-coupled anion symporter [Colwellia sp.]|nr:DASS family sodium-coupled anion symporter [Colwellia sp.]MCW8865091.1 DASS family sodium-coupled anion symporter [Colwellia sp.]MCW9082904.1 DASS family sodium-coupled anion symporter [Colwellia sp.]
MNRKQVINILIAIFVAFLVAFSIDAQPSVQQGMGIFVAIAWLWITQALPISTTALLIPILAMASGLLSASQAFENFANPVIFLFMGGFALAAALQKYSLDQLFANKMLSFSGGSPLKAILLLFLTTAILSMWISNTATVALMLPIALGLLSSYDAKTSPNLTVFVLLGLAYSGNLGGMATLIGSPPNAIAASAANLSFADWLTWGLPMFALLFPLMIFVLFIIFRPTLSDTITINLPKVELSWQRSVVILIFTLTALGWIFSAPLSTVFGIDSGFDAMLAVIAIVLLTGSQSLPFDEFIKKTNWGILILFGGGLTLSALLKSSGASLWLANMISSYLPANNAWLVLIIICAFVIFLTELVSNTASAALLVPLFMTVALDLGLPPVGIAVVIALCASCAFMLPVATPPNAIVFSSGLVSQKQMMRAGLVLNLTFAVVIASVAAILF